MGILLPNAAPVRIASLGRQRLCYSLKLKDCMTCWLTFAPLAGVLPPGILPGVSEADMIL